MPDFGQLSEIDLRKLWINEAADFTPWLAENIDTLGRALGLDLELKSRETSVGAFSCDLHARDLASGRSVVIENQLEATDHDHLGKLLTYAAGLEASVIVWVAKEIRDEHRAALEWLNRKTGTDTHFFAVVPRVFRIDNSKPAYEFQLIVSPNEWEDIIVEPPQPPSPREETYKRFFQALIDCLREEHQFCNARKAQPQSWIRLSSQINSNIGFYVAFTRSRTLKVELFVEYSARDKCKELFDALFERKQVIEHELGEQLAWERLDEGIGSRLALYKDGVIDATPDDLEVLRKWAISKLLLFREKLSPHVRETIQKIG